MVLVGFDVFRLEVGMFCWISTCFRLFVRLLSGAGLFGILLFRVFVLVWVVCFGFRFEDYLLGLCGAVRVGVLVVWFVFVILFFCVFVDCVGWLFWILIVALLVCLGLLWLVGLYCFLWLLI